MQNFALVERKRETRICISKKRCKSAMMKEIIFLFQLLDSTRSLYKVFALVKDRFASRKSSHEDRWENHLRRFDRVGVTRASFKIRFRKIISLELILDLAARLDRTNLPRTFEISAACTWHKSRVVSHFSGRRGPCGTSELEISAIGQFAIKSIEIENARGETARALIVPLVVRAASALQLFNLWYLSPGALAKRDAQSANKSRIIGSARIGWESLLQHANNRRSINFW